MNTVSLKLPLETGNQLRALGHAFNKPLTDVVAGLLILAAEHHRVALPIDSVDIALKPEGIVVTMNDFAFRPMNPKQTLSFAQSVTATIDRYDQLLDLDVPDLILVRRIGTGIEISVTRDRVPEFRRTFSRGSARLLVHALTTVAAQEAINA
jgi:hypothetical protein